MESKKTRGKRREINEDPDFKLSKALSWLLRHAAVREGFKIDAGGFLKVVDILQHGRFQGFTVDDVRRVVETNSKQRFTLMIDEESGQLLIRANQGHSLEVKELELTPITSPGEVPCVVHGTSKAAWNRIRQQGLSRMERNHIHFAPGFPGENGVISGMRNRCDVNIFIDMNKTLKDGYKFYRSANNVILSPGNEEGLIPPGYFSEVRIK